MSKETDRIMYNLTIRQSPGAVMIHKENDDVFNCLIGAHGSSIKIQCTAQQVAIWINGSEERHKHWARVQEIGWLDLLPYIEDAIVL